MKVYLLICVIAMIFVTGETFKCYEKQLSEGVIDVSKAKTINCILDMCFKGVVTFFNGSIHSKHDCFPPTSRSKISQWSQGELFQLLEIEYQSTGFYLCNNTELCNHAQSVSSSVVILLFTSIIFFIVFQNFN